jgi:CheY-like chemotaxis protein
VVRPAAQAKQIDLRLALGDACVVAADAARLQQVVWNLVSNAVKFTSDHGRIDLGVERTHAGVTIEVADTGVGIDPDFLPHVFDRFRQYDGSTTRRKGGLGRGQAIVRHLTELHGGSVVARSDGPGRGATFTVTLPTSIVREASGQAPSGAPVHAPGAGAALQELGGLRILVVDDEPDVREVLCAALAIWGAEVFSTESAAGALAQMTSIRPDVLVCDIGMPDMDGYTLMRELRARPPSAGGLTPAIAVTGFARPEDMSRAMAAGYQVHVAKPVDLGTFAQKIAKLVGRDCGRGQSAAGPA